MGARQVMEDKNGMHMVRARDAVLGANFLDGLDDHFGSTNRWFSQSG